MILASASQSRAKIGLDFNFDCIPQPCNINFSENLQFLSIDPAGWRIDLEDLSCHLLTSFYHFILNTELCPTLYLTDGPIKMPSVPTPSKSGIIENPDGERHIPSSVRPDGTKRKEIKIRPGYKPPEDVEVYKNRTADAWKNRGSGGVPGAEGLKDETVTTASSNKNAKRREARKKAKAAEEEDDKKEATGSDKKDWRETNDENKKSEGTADPEAEKEKKARNLKKKLKQAKELKEKKEGGAALLPEQFAKVIKINELIRELDALGFDAEGEPKAKEEEKKE
jgi:partner of Y14 and mago protein